MNSPFVRRPAIRRPAIRRLMPLLLLCGSFGTLLLGDARAQAATFAVTTLRDDATDGICDVVGSSDGCTLREALATANTQEGDDTIIFTPGLTGVLTLQSTLRISSDIRLIGPGTAGTQGLFSLS